MLNINDIKPYEKNAKKHPESQLLALANIVQEVGWRQPALIDQKGILVVGHGRLETYLKYKDSHELKPIWIIDDKGKTVHGEPESTPLTEDQAKAYRLADNKLNESDWDMNLVIEDLKDLNGDMIDLTGFDRSLILEDDKNEDDVPEEPKEAKTKLGDIYEINGHKIMCGNSTKIEDMAKLMSEQKADMVFTDPPYIVDYSGSEKNTSEKITNDKMDNKEFLQFLLDSFEQTKQFTKKGAGCYIFHSHKTASTFEKALLETGFLIDTQLIWNKPSAGLGANHYKTKHEPFFYCSQQKDKTFYGDRTGTTVWKIPRDEDKAFKWWQKHLDREEKGKSTIWSLSRANVNENVHPTQKPVELPAITMLKSTKREDIILDQFLGSGTSLIAAEKMERKCYGMELDPKYVDVIIQRYVNYTGITEIMKNGIPELWEVTKVHKETKPNLDDTEKPDSI